jgi:hypothetical protein
VGSYFVPVFYTMLQIIVLLAVGFALRKLDRLSSRFFQDLGRFMVRVALPVYFFVRLAQTRIEDVRQGLVFPPIAIAVIGIALVFSLLLVRLTPFRDAERRGALALCSFGNAGYVPLSLVEIFPVTLPMIAERFGTSTPTLFIGTYLLAHSPVLWAAGNYLISGHAHRPRVSEILTPPLQGIIAGLCVPLFGLHAALFDPNLPFLHLFRALERIGSLALPLVLISIGAMIADLRFHAEQRSRLLTMAGLVSTIRFLLLPASFFAGYFLVFRPLGFSPVVLWIVFLEMHTPPATNLAVMASQSGTNQDTAAFTIMVTYVLFVLLLPLYLVAFLSLPGLFGG